MNTATHYENANFLPELADEEPAFLDDDGPSAEIPPFITTTNARDLYDLRPDETLSEAIARHNVKEARKNEVAEATA